MIAAAAGALVAINAGTGFVGQLLALPRLLALLDGPVLLAIAAVGAAGSLAGRRLAGRFDDRTLRRIFAGALVVLAILVLADARPAALAAS